MALCRELTKKYEEGIRMTLREAADYYQKEEPRGEFVLVIEGQNEKEAEEEKQAAFAEQPLREHLQTYLDQGLDRKEAMRCVAKDRGCSRREIYQALLSEEEE